MKFNDVFVVDDDKIYQFLIKKLLASNNIEVNPFFYENGQEALDGIKDKLHKGENPPDLILLDINMPILDGWQFLEEYKKLKENIKNKISIYVITSSDNTVDRSRAKDFDEEITNYVLKPMTSDAIKSIFAI
ncbi:response regulator [Flavobacterium sp. j3]|uniref:Response regulator n=1 Tax=Flavobacterium aureirubrum TaxID=3133147 RepID=A0ABU9N3I0_9FLAO